MMAQMKVKVFTIHNIILLKFVKISFLLKNMLLNILHSLETSKMEYTDGNLLNRTKKRNRAVNDRRKSGVTSAWMTGVMFG